MRVYLILIMLLLAGCAVQPKSPVKMLGNEPITTMNDSGRIGSWNLQVFGDAKVADAAKLSTIVDVVDDVDVMAVQEIRDSDGSSVKVLMDELSGYNIVVSDRLGRSTSKEQYAFIYKKGITVKNAHVYNDVSDVFEREPYIATFTLKNTEYTFINVHVKPDDAQKEIEALAKVIEDVNMPNTILLGDLNADCTYYKPTTSKIREYEWIIPDTADTTTGSTDCAYDRIILANWQAPKPIEVYTPVKQNIPSDHYPVEAII